MPGAVDVADHRSVIRGNGIGTYLSNSMSGVMVARNFLVLRQLDHVLTLSVERDYQLTIPAQAVDFKKHLIPREFG